MARREGQPKHASDAAKPMKDPPMIVTKQGSPSDDTDSKRELRQARTPKHANTKVIDESSKDTAAASRHFHPGHEYPPHSRPPPPGHQHGAVGYEYPPQQDYRYDQRLPAPFSPGQQQYYQRGREPLPPTVSPGTNAYRQGYYGHGRQEQPPRYGRYDSRYTGPDRADYNYSYQVRAGGAQPTYPPQDARFYNSRSSYPPREYTRGPPAEGRLPDGTTPFTRAVSSSFDRSVKSRSGDPDMKAPYILEPKGIPSPVDLQADGNNSVAHSEDSWRQLKQVASIDENEMQKRLAALKSDDKGRNILVNQEPASSSSSLTNSPHDGVAHAAKAQGDVELSVGQVPLPTPSKLAALDSLSSIASGQEPLETHTETKKAGAGPPSPGSSAGSLDLMKCHSGSSGLLHGFPHQRGMSSGSLDYAKLESMRSREERGDTSTGETDVGEIRRAPPGSDDSTQPPPKKARTNPDPDSLDEVKEKSPLGIECSPPHSSTGERRQSSQQLPHAGSRGSYFDKAPSYTYSLDSNPGGHRDRLGHRPPSASSSTITPGERHHEQDAVGLSVPSWDLQQQDSFGNVSAVGGGHLMSNFSFSQDYPSLANSGSNLGYNDGRRDHHPRGHGALPPPMTETRNQSFDGGHYHGDFNNSEGLDHVYPHNPPRQAFPQRHPAYPPQDNYKQHKGSFPPQAPSWGTTTSAGSHAHPPPYRGPPPHYNSYPSGPPVHPPPQPYVHMNRNYSEDSVHRTSPPTHIALGAPPQHGGFQPPPEFSAPHNPHLSRRPPPAVYIMSSSGSAGDPGNISKSRAAGIYTWTKEDDSRLTDVMKKYKNPRDWEPIAKDHGRGKSAKECHERWIRYLKPGVRKGQWQDHEDAIVVEAVTTSSEQPFTRWSDLAQRLPGRVGKQIRDRWVNHLNPNINHLPFSREDDLLLWNGHKKYGKRWVEISTKYFNSGRSENHIKNRWYSASFKKFIANEFGPDAHSGGPSTATKKSDGKFKSKGKKTEMKAEQVEAV